MRLWDFFFKRYRSEEIGELSKISIGDALYDEAKRNAVKDLSPIVTIESGVFSGTHVVRDEDRPTRPKRAKNRRRTQS